MPEEGDGGVASMPLSPPDSPKAELPQRPVTSMGTGRPDGAASSSVAPEPQAPRPATSMGAADGRANGSKKRPSITGMNLGTGLGAQGMLMHGDAGSRAAFVSTPGPGRDNSTTPGPGIGERMGNKYYEDVRSCVDRHKGRSKTPLSVKTPLPPDHPQHRSRAQSERKRPSPGRSDSKMRFGSKDSWSAILKDDSFIQQMELRLATLPTGNFEENYGPDGKHTGAFLYGMRHGKGLNQFRGETYEGDWKWDKRNGRGTLTLRDGSKAEGTYKDGRLHGFATLSDKDGCVVFEGEFRHGRRHGLGRQMFESGDCYDGGWEDGRFQDRGVYYFTNGDKLYGMWNKGVYHGAGVFHYVDGSVSRRTYDNGIITSVQDYERSTQRFGMPLTREEMHKHTRDADFPKNLFLLHTI